MSATSTRPPTPGPSGRTAREGTFFSRAMRPLNTTMERFIPSSLVFTIVLTFAVAALCLLLTPAGPADVVVGWGDGLSGLLAFITQMALVLMLGHILANTGPVRRLLARLASIPRTPLAAYIFVFVVAAAASLITWGLGLVVGALLAKEVAAQARERGLVLHFPMLVAAGFSGFVVWHMGYSGSGPLTAATPGSFLTESLGGRTVPVSETTFSWWNITAASENPGSSMSAPWPVVPAGRRVSAAPGLRGPPGPPSTSLPEETDGPSSTSRGSPVCAPDCERSPLPRCTDWLRTGPGPTGSTPRLEPEPSSPTFSCPRGCPPWISRISPAASGSPLSKGTSGRRAICSATWRLSSRGSASTPRRRGKW